MGLNADSKYYERYYDHVLYRKKEADSSLAKVFNIIDDLSDRRGIKWEWNAIDADIQDEIIEKWQRIIKED